MGRPSFLTFRVGLWASVRTIAFVAAMLGVGSVSTASEASAVSSTVRGSTVRTVAVVSGSVLGFAQDDRYLAWLLPGPREPDLAEGSVGVVAVQNLGTGVRTRLPVHPEGFGSPSPLRRVSLSRATAPTGSRPVGRRTRSTLIL